MTTSKWMNMGDVIKVHSQNIPDKQAISDKFKKYTFKEWNERANRLSSTLKSMGVGYGDRFAILAYNCVEWMEIYLSCAKGGQVAVPIMFRLAPPEIEYVVNHAECKAFIVAKEFVDTVNSIKDKLPIPKDNYIFFGDDKTPEG
ncbi:MAG: long-chain fatty acid--CoA ligase, partial [Spirochaetes bacterium]